MEEIRNEVIDSDKHGNQKEDQCAFVGCIMDIFEDFLSNKGVSFPETPALMREAGMNEDEIVENDVVLFGDNYSAISDRLEDTLRRWGLFTE